MRAQLRAHHALELPRVPADERDLARGGEVEVERLEQVRERRGVLGGDRVQQPQLPERELLVGGVAGERRQAQQPEGRRARTGRDRHVLELLAPRDELLVVVRGGEEAAVLAVGEAREDRVGHAARLGEPALLERRLVQRQQRLEQVRVVLEVGVQPALAVLPGAQQAGRVG